MTSIRQAWNTVRQYYRAHPTEPALLVFFLLGVAVGSGHLVWISWFFLIVAVGGFYLSWIREVFDRRRAKTKS